MEESLEKYRQKLTAYSNSELQEIRNSIDNEKHRDRLHLVMEEISTRKSKGLFESDLKPSAEDKYGTLLRRVGAGIVDAILFIVLTLVFLKPFQAMESGNIDLLGMNLVGVAAILYSILMHWRFGATLGKLICKVKVVDNTSEAKISFKQAVIRDIVPFGVVVISTIENGVFKKDSSFLISLADSIDGWWGFAEIVSALFNRKRRAVHDMMAGTVCINVVD